MNYTFKLNIKFLAIALLLVVGFTSCFKDLNRKPKYGYSSELVYSDVESIKSVLAKIYGGLVLTGQNGPAGNGDVAGIDEGFSSYIRCLWKLQETTTDEAVIGWGDPGLPVLNTNEWSATNDWTTAMYYRIAYQITLANEFIRETSDEKLTERKITGADAEEVRRFRNEARFMRALSYYHALDMYRNFPFTTEENKVGSEYPKQGSASEIYNFIESELLAIEPNMAAPKSNEYGRADQAAAWMLLSKLYLNSPIYVNTNNNSKVITYTQKVIDAGYSLAPQYGHNFLADNHTSPEMIFSANFDGVYSKTYGGTTLLTHAAIGGTMNPADFGVNGGWAGIRSRRDLVNKFDSMAGDSRAMFHTDGQINDVEKISEFKYGLGVAKWKNITKTGEPGSNIEFVDIDFPIFRLADAYLMYAEANLRGGGGNAVDALNYVNMLKERAYGNTSGNITSADLNLDYILDERSRELYWEAQRRTDLIRFGKYNTANYLWQWKGGVYEGKSFPAYRNIFPIPALDLNANPNLKQNTGY